MKRFALFLGGLLILPAFGEVAPIFYDDYDVEYVDAEYADDDVITDEEFAAEEETPVTPAKIVRKQAVSRNNANRASATRTAPSNTTAGVTSRNRANGNSARVVAARTGTVSSTRSGRGVATRSTTPNATRGAVSRTRSATTATTSGRNETPAASVARSATGTARRTTKRVMSLEDETGTLYNPNNVAETGTTLTTQTRVGMRAASGKSPVIRVASSSGVSSDGTSVASTSAEMDELAELTDYCKAQYAACMDNYCNVLDENQGRCSCSSNLKNYAKSEAALKQATAELQEVAQKIQYIGLTTREVETLFSQTEAELTMQSKVDNSQIKTNLDKIKSMIIDVKTANANSSTSSNINFDITGLLDFTIDSTGFDLSSFIGGMSNNSNNISNQRGEDLFKTATNRCKTTVLRACTAQGVDAAFVTNAYDLEIDKECMAYEKSLNESNDQMVATVRNAKGVLQKARLMVAQAKNEYDMRGCINALDACMQDEFVCGSEYENCLDPTGRYIVNGEVVVGSQPGHAIDPDLSGSEVMTSDVCKVNLYRTWDYGGKCATYTANAEHQHNAWGAGTKDSLADYIAETVKAGAAKKASTNMAEYLQNKIGYMDKDKSYGMCVSVLNKCQDFTYTGKGTTVTYNEENDVIKQYLSRVLVQIKAKQDSVLAEYAEGCITDVQSCLTQNSYPSEEPSTWDNTNNYQVQANIAVNACRSQIVTCMSVNGYSVLNPTPNEMNCWIMGLLFNTSTSDCGDVYPRQ